MADAPHDPLSELADDPAEAGPDVELRPLSIGESLHGQRLDRALVALAPEFSRSYLQQLIDSGAVSIGGRPALKASQRVRAGEQGMLELRPTPQSQAFLPQPMALDVVHEDGHLCVINKPAGLVVHPAPGHWQGTLLNGLLARDPQARLLPRAGIVHRLDKDTSGLMVVARTRSAMDALVQAIAATLLIANTVLIAARTRSTEISIMRLVGATRWYTQLPFFVEALLAALVGVVLAIIGLIIVRAMFLEDVLNQFYQAGLIAKVDYADVLVYCAPLMLLLGLGMAGITAYVTLRAYIRR